MTNPEHDRSVVEELLVHTIYDWIDLGHLRTIVREMYPGAPSLHTASMAVVTELISNGLVAAGDVRDGHFDAWACTRDEAVARIDREWRAQPDPSVLPFQVAALAPTHAGLAIVADVMTREGADDSWRRRAFATPPAQPHQQARTPDERD